MQVPLTVMGPSGNDRARQTKEKGSRINALCFTDIPSEWASFLWKLWPLQRAMPKHNRTSTWSNKDRYRMEQGYPRPGFQPEPSVPGSSKYCPSNVPGCDPPHQPLSAPQHPSGPHGPARDTHSRATCWESESLKVQKVI